MTPAAVDQAFRSMVASFPKLELDVNYLHLRDLPDVCELRRQVFAGLPDPDMVLPEPDEEGYVKKLLQPGNAVIGMRRASDGALVGYGAVLFSTEESDLPALAGLDPAYRLRSAEIASCMLDKSLRGHRLQRAFLSVRERIAWARGRSYLQVMTSPKNGPSRHNLLVAGYALDWAGWVPDPKRVRLILAKDLLAPKRPMPPTNGTTTAHGDLNSRTARLRVLHPDDALRVAVDDPDGLSQAIRDGWVSFVDDWKAGVLVFHRGSPRSTSLIAGQSTGERRRPTIAEQLAEAMVGGQHYVIDHVLTHCRALLCGVEGAQLFRLLVLAARTGPVEVMRALLSAGVSADEGNGLAVATAAVAGNDNCLRFLLEHGASPRAPYQHKPAGALLEATRLGNSVAVELLLQAAGNGPPEMRFRRAELEAALVMAPQSLSFMATRALDDAIHTAQN